jgi:hypothetical protein
LQNPDLEPDKRPTPNIMQNIAQLKRKEITTTKPSDLWNEEDDYLFLKYCPSKRDKAYHTIAKDSACRPSEILNLKIKDLLFKKSADEIKQYVIISVNGKTGTRSLPLYSAVPYVKDWLDNHPQGKNPNAYLIPSFNHNTKFGNKMKEISLNVIYQRYRTKFFPGLLQDPKVVPEDKIKIKDMIINRKWHPYIQRHTALTKKSKILRESSLRQFAGWKDGSSMHLKYVHYFGNEATESLLAEYGIIDPNSTKEKNRILSEKMLPKICPNCNESNIHDSKFCNHCRFILSYDAYNETLGEQKIKDKRLEDMEKELAEQRESQNKIIDMLFTLDDMDMKYLNRQDPAKEAERQKTIEYYQKKAAMAKKFISETPPKAGGERETTE